MICQITFKCRSKVHSSCSTLYTAHILRVAFYVFTSYIMNINSTAKGVFVHILWVGCCGIPLHEKNFVVFAVVSVTFVLFARFALIFLFRNWKLELQSVFGGVGEMLH